MLARLLQTPRSGKYDFLWNTLTLAELATADIATHAFTLIPPPSQLDLTNQFIGDLKSAKDPNFNLAGTNLERTVAEKVCGVWRCGC